MSGEELASGTHRDDDVQEYWVPMKEYEGGVQWEWLGRGSTPEEARENALDNYEESHGYRPLPNGDPTRRES